jgi:prepilin-type N-terminal cleavage/methylation domain-containing protein
MTAPSVHFARSSHTRGKGTVRTRITGKDGFTLIELMIVIVIIGILASMAVSTWQNRKADAIIAGMKSDLRNLAVAEEAYLVDNATYTSDTDDLAFRLSPQVVLTLQADQDGWTARATHPAISKECGLFVGRIAPLSPARGEGIVWCE